MKYHFEWPSEFQTVERKFLTEIENLERPKVYFPKIDCIPYCQSQPREIVKYAGIQRRITISFLEVITVLARMKSATVLNFLRKDIEDDRDN